MKINLEKARHIHLVGIGGISMSAIAEILLMQGYIVSGSDFQPSPITERLASHGASIYYEHDPENVTDADILVYSSAIADDNPELIKAKELGLGLYKRSEMLGSIMRQFESSIAISGTHGKSTTTSMVSVILHKTTLDPTLLVGAELKEIGGNMRVGQKDEVIVSEACEYKGNFLDFHYTIGAVMNIDEDHLDYFRDLNHIIETFQAFTNKIPKNGSLILNNDDYNVRALAGHTQAKVISYGINTEATYEAKNITYNDLGYPAFDVFLHGEKLLRIQLQVPGRYNIYNALAAITITHSYGIDSEIIEEALGNFSGANRRFEYKGTFNEAMLYEDYAHHPVAIKGLLEAVEKAHYQDTVIVFQPHTYTRTSELLEEFALALTKPTKVFITDIYAAREKNDQNIHASDLVDAINNLGGNASYAPSIEEAASMVKPLLRKGTIMIAVGAGNINSIFTNF